LLQEIYCCPQAQNQQFTTNGGVNWISADVQSHADSGRSKGWGLASFNTPEDAQHAMNALNNIELDGRPVNLREVRTSPETMGHGQCSS
jgi:RNA recognition motif-containing protein